MREMHDREGWKVSFVRREDSGSVEIGTGYPRRTGYPRCTGYLQCTRYVHNSKNMRKIRKPAVAGAFYPGNRDELTSMIEEMMDAAADVAVKGSVKGIVVPHAGYVYSGISL